MHHEFEEKLDCNFYKFFVILVTSELFDFHTKIGSSARLAVIMGYYL